jgi:hypothetical protein
MNASYEEGSEVKIYWVPLSISFRIFKLQTLLGSENTTVYLSLVSSLHKSLPIERDQ